MAGNIAVIICAAGTSSRFGGKRKKPFVDVGGRAAFLYSAELFSNHPDVKQIIMAISPEDDEIVSVKWGANLKFFGIKLCFGGAERFETVQKALSLVRDDIEYVAIHDAARCCIQQQWIDSVFAAAVKSGSAILACPVVGTVKEAKEKTIVKTVDRTNLYEAQTPQVFRADIIKKAYTNLKNLNGSKISDDSQLVEALGEKVAIVETDSSNMKITYPSDVSVAEAIIKGRPKPKPQGPAGPYIEAQW